MSDPVVAIIGRPNVGKSTLFNRLLGRRIAIVDDQPGVTRDRNYAQMSWNGQQFFLVDTGGYLPHSPNIMDRAIREQVTIAMEEADVLLYLVDVRTGISDIDEDIANLLRRSEKPVLLTVNKVDDKRDDAEVSQFYRLGLGDPVPVSAMIGRQSGDLLDKITALLREVPVREEQENAVKLAIIGKENVGKSSLVNTLLDRERQIVTEIPGTTRDSIDSVFNYRKNTIVLIDTAGLKKKAKIKENILFYSNVRTYRSLQRCDIVLYLISAVEKISRQDVGVLQEAHREGKGIVLVVNKWDMIAKDHKTMKEWQVDLKERLGELRYIPIIFTSVPEKQRLYKTLDLALRVYEERNKRIPTAVLNEFFEPLIKNNTPPAVRGREIKVKYVTQVKATPPLFAFYSNYPDLIADHYKRFLENKLRAQFGFEGVPLRFSFRKK